jgi:hypothetical protein
MNNLEEIKLTAAQRAKKKYYDKIKNTPEYITRRNKSSNDYYHNKLKSDEEFKIKQSIKKREYYYKNKIEPLLDITV